MAKFKQPWLPKVKVEKVVSQNFPQPKLPSKVKAPRKFEILHHPFDLRFRGRINKWLIFLQEVKEVELEEVVGEESAKIIRLYFFPQGKKKRWLNQEEVLRKTKIPYNKILKKKLIVNLMRLWNSK